MFALAELRTQMPRPTRTQVEQAFDRYRQCEKFASGKIYNLVNWINSRPWNNATPKKKKYISEVERYEQEMESKFGKDQEAWTSFTEWRDGIIK